MCTPTSPSLFCSYDPLAPTQSKVCGITYIVLGVLLLATAALLIYSLATVAPSEVWCDFHQVVHEVSAQPYIVLPVLFLGLPGIGIMFCGFNKMNCFSCASEDSGLPSHDTPEYVRLTPMTETLWQ